MQFSKLLKSVHFVCRWWQRAKMSSGSRSKSSPNVEGWHGCNSLNNNRDAAGSYAPGPDDQVHFMGQFRVNFIPVSFQNLRIGRERYNYMYIIIYICIGSLNRFNSARVRQGMQHLHHRCRSRSKFFKALMLETKGYHFGHASAVIRYKINVPVKILKPIPVSFQNKNW